MSAAVNIKFYQQTFPRDFIAYLSQPPAGCPRPERRELFRAQLDFALFAMAVSTHLERERLNVALLPKADLSAGDFRCQITLLNNKASPLLQILRQSLDQKFSFDFAIVSRSVILSHKFNIVSVMHSVSRFSRIAL